MNCVSRTAVAASFVCSQSFHFSLAAQSSLWQQTLLWLIQPLRASGAAGPEVPEGRPSKLEGHQGQCCPPGCVPQGVDQVSSCLWRL